MKNKINEFNILARTLHWLMAIMVLAMLFIGASMMTSFLYRPWLYGWHVFLGFCILFLVIIRLVNRLMIKTPSLPTQIPAVQKYIAKASHWLLYACMLILPLLGWGTLSAGGYPISPLDGVIIPPILPVNATLYEWLRAGHGVIANIFYAIIVLHISAALLHVLVLKDGVFEQITLKLRKLKK